MSSSLLRRVRTALFVAASLAVAVVVAPASAQAAAGGDTPPAMTAGDTATVGSFAPKGEPQLGASTGLAHSRVAAAAATPCPDACFFYNTAYGNAVTNGVVANVFVAQPTVAAADYHSIAELAVMKTINGQRNIVEVGWTVDRQGTNGTDLTRPHLFVYHWVNGQRTCYNGCGWVDYQPTTLNAGDPLTPGAAVEMKIQYDDASQAWWIRVGGEWIGYFPLTLWTGATTAVAGFTETDAVQTFGEVAASTDQPCTTMGVDGSKGYLGSTGTPRPAYIASVSYLDGTAVDTDINPDFFAKFNDVTQDGLTNEVYSMNAPTARSFYYGGDGFC